jgi:hypothetical protein
MNSDAMNILTHVCWCISRELMIRVELLNLAMCEFYYVQNSNDCVLLIFVVWGFENQTMTLLYVFYI